MNNLKGKIIALNTNGSLSLVTIKINDDVTFKAIVIDTPDTVAYLKKDNLIKVLFKETEVVIGTNIDHKISLQNRIKGTIKEIKQGVLLSKVVIATDVGDIVSVVSTTAIKELSLEETKEVQAMVKLNEIMIAE